MDLGKLKRQLITGAGVTFAGSCGTLFFSLLLTLVLGRILDLSAFGLMSAALATVSLAYGIVDVRFGEAVTKFGTEFIANRKEGKAVGLILAAYGLEVFLCAITFSILFFPASFIARAIFLKPEMADLIRVVAFVPLASCSSATSAAVLRTFNRFTAISAASIFASICRFALPVGLCLISGGNLGRILAGHAGASLLGMVLFTALAAGTVRARFPGVRPESIWVDLRRIVPFTAQTLLGIVFKTLSRGDIAIAIVTRYRPEVEISYLKIGLQITGLLNIVPTAVSFVTYPSLAELWARGEKGLFLRLVRKLSKMLAVAMGAGGLATIAAAPIFIRVWKADFLPAMSVIYWLAAAAAVDGVCCWIRPAALSLGRPGISTLVNFVRMVALVGIGLLLVPRMGYVGIGVATLALSVSSISLGAFLVVRFARRGEAAPDSRKESDEPVEPVK